MVAVSPAAEPPGLTTPLMLLLGGRTAARLAKASLITVSDLLRHYPRRYTERGRLTDLSHIRPGDRVTVWARIDKVTTRMLPRTTGGRRRPKSVTTVRVTDGSRAINCTFFNQPWMDRKLLPGMEALFSGKVSAFRGAPQLTGPDIASTDASLGDVSGVLETLETFAGGIIPVYPLTEGLTGGLLQVCVKRVLDVVVSIDDPLPEELRARRDLMGLTEALRNIHRPATPELLRLAQDRLRYDEALAMQLVLARRRAADRLRPATACPPTDGGLADAFDAMLPFTLTDGQAAVGTTIADELASDHPMNRLLHGEVGSGKTVVALRAMLQVVDAGHQAVLLAPTEVLAAQHARSLRDLLGPLGRGGELGADPRAITITLLTGSLPAARRRRAAAELASGRPGIAVGTHALLADRTIVTNLGLVVVDEQHRFGVEQRHALIERSDPDAVPHTLVMTATPIPRTVAMTVYGDLETSALTELPAGRAPVATTVVPAADKPEWLARAFARVAEEVAAGHQAYIVCPRIGGDDADSGPDSQTGRRPPLAVVDVAAYLRDGPLAGVRLAELHGRMPGADKDRVMQAFADGEIDVLVATTVIEVGVDVANAAVMIIMDAERFGMSQLHQLRGRIGRGAVPGVCLLVTEAPAGAAGRARLDAVAATSDGFELAERDLELRREGDVLGTSQAGRVSSLKQLSLLRDRDVIARARDDAGDLVAADPALAGSPQLAAMADAIIDTDSQEYLEKG